MTASMLRTVVETVRRYVQSARAQAARSPARPRLLAAAIALAVLPAWAGPTSQRERELTALLLQDCGSCHGLTLKGGLGPPLLPQNLTGKPDELLLATILDGRPCTAMPPWRPLLSEEEARWLVERLRAGVGP
jgi:cytochrome c55X